MVPGNVDVDAVVLAAIHETEDVRRAGIAVLITDRAGQPVILVELLIDSRIEIVLVADGDDGRLIIQPGAGPIG